MHIVWKFKDQFENLEGIKVAKQAVKCLGILVGHDKIDLPYLNLYI